MQLSPVRSVIIRVMMTTQREFDLFITSMITDGIGRHKVLLTINHKSHNIGKKKNSQVMKERENLQLKENCNFYVNCNRSV